MLCCFHDLDATSRQLVAQGYFPPHHLLRIFLACYFSAHWVYCKVQCLMDGSMFQDSQRGKIFQFPLGWFFLWLFRGLSNKLTVSPALWLQEEGMSPVLPPIHDPMSFPLSELVVATNQDTSLTLCSIKSDWYLGVCRGLWHNTPLLLLSCEVGRRPNTLLYKEHLEWAVLMETLP